MWQPASKAPLLTAHIRGGKGKRTNTPGTDGLPLPSLSLSAMHLIPDKYPDLLNPPPSCSSAVPGCLTTTHPSKVGQGHTGLPQDTPESSHLPTQLPDEASVTAAETLVQSPARMKRKGRFKRTEAGPDRESNGLCSNSPRRCCNLPSVGQPTLLGDLLF